MAMSLRPLLRRRRGCDRRCRVARRVGAGFGAHQQAEILSERSFRLARVAEIEFLGDDQAQHPVAEKFEPLIGRIGLALAAAAMGECRLEQIAVAEV